MRMPAERALVEDFGFDDALMGERLPAPRLCKRAVREIQLARQLLAGRRHRRRALRLPALSRVTENG
jgi:hypothetical protein